MTRTDSVGTASTVSGQRSMAKALRSISPLLIFVLLSMAAVPAQASHLPRCRSHPDTQANDPHKPAPPEPQYEVVAKATVRCYEAIDVVLVSVLIWRCTDEDKIPAEGVPEEDWETESEGTCHLFAYDNGAFQPAPTTKQFVRAEGVAPLGGAYYRTCAFYSEGDDTETFDYVKMNSSGWKWVYTSVIPPVGDE
jgi:hypothetical protein